MEYQETIQGRSKAMVCSVLCHAGAAIVLFISLKMPENKPAGGSQVVEVSLIQPSALSLPPPPAPPGVVEPVSVPETPASDPVVQPQPETVVPPKPKPVVTPKPVPTPKPVVTPKPVPAPKPVPKPVVKPTPVVKPVTKPVVTKPVNQPAIKPVVQKKSRADSIRERMKQSKVEKVKGVPGGTNVKATDSRGKTGASSAAPSNYASKYASQVGAGLAAETADYANNVVRPYVYANWHQPAASELEYRNITPVEVSFVVSSMGRISQFRFNRRSNSRKVNESIQAFFDNLDHLPSLASAGVKASQLKIVVELSLKD